MPKLAWKSHTWGTSTIQLGTTSLLVLPTLHLSLGQMIHTQRDVSWTFWIPFIFGQIFFFFPFRSPQQLNNRISSEVARAIAGSAQSFRSPKNSHQQQFYGLCMRKHQFRLRFAMIHGNQSPWAPKRIKTEEEVCTHPCRSKPWSFIKYWKQQRFTLDRDEGCIILVPAASLGKHAPSIRGLSRLTDWRGKGQEDVTIAMPSAMLRTPSSLPSTALGKQSLEIKPASAAVYTLSSVGTWKWTQMG